MRKNPPLPPSTKKIQNSRSQSIQRLSKQQKKVELPSISRRMTEGLEQRKREPRKQNVAEEALNNLIHEYLIKYNYMETLNAFQQEYYNESPTEEQHLKQQLLSAYDKGQRELFFQRFNKYVPINIRLKDERTTKLQFYLNIYFLVYTAYGIGNQSASKKKYTIENHSKQAFKHYLESRGAALAKTSEFLPFYALVYIDHPQENPSFKHIFAREWADQLRQKLVSFIEFLYPAEKTPLIVQIYQKYIESSLKEEDSSVSKVQQVDEPKQDELVPARISGQASIAQINKMEEQIKELKEYNEATTEKYMILWNNFKQFEQRVKNTIMESQTKWFQITQQFFNISSSLLHIVNNLKRGIPLENQEILENIKKKVSKYESFVNTNIEDLISENIDFSLFDRQSVSAENDASAIDGPSLKHARSVYEGRAQLIQIDFEKVKATLNSEDAGNIRLLLQAIRWRITHLRGIFPKRQAVIVCTKSDIIGSSGPDRSRLLRKLLHWEPGVIWQTVQFVNALSGDYQGRTYLQNQSFIECIIEVMLKEKSDTSVRKLLLTTLQKLSMRRAAQLCMVNNGLVKWAINIIKAEKQTMSEFSLEYITALLMNLSLSDQGLQKCEEVRDDVLKIQIQLLQNQSPEVRTFASATIFAVLSLKSFRIKAREYGLGDIITYLKQSSPQEFLVQLEYLEKLLQLGDDEQEEEEEDVESDYDVDEINDEPMGDELTGNDYTETVQTNGKLTGQSLLIKEYALTGPAFIDHKSAIHEEVENSLKRRENSFIRNNDASVDRPISQNRSVMRPFMKSRSMIGNNNSSYSQTSSNRILPSEMRQRNSRPKENNEELLNKPISPISPGPRPLKQYEKAPQYRFAFETKNALPRTPPQKQS